MLRDDTVCHVLSHGLTATVKYAEYPRPEINCPPRSVLKENPTMLLQLQILLTNSDSEAGPAFVVVKVIDRSKIG